MEKAAKITFVLTLIVAISFASLESTNAVEIAPNTKFVPASSLLSYFRSLKELECMPHSQCCPDSKPCPSEDQECKICAHTYPALCFCTDKPELNKLMLRWATCCTPSDLKNGVAVRIESVSPSTRLWISRITSAPTRVRGGSYKHASPRAELGERQWSEPVEVIEGSIEDVSIPEKGTVSQLWFAPIKTKLVEQKNQAYQKSLADWSYFAQGLNEAYGVDMSTLTMPYHEEQKKYYLQTSLWSNLYPGQVISTQLNSYQAKIHGFAALM
ncbi:hypothetical protein SELMODRAFT_432465 [Selaginella moellendorffii]|uniref:Uncharacterized protein n=1 Tax=Selaginella moellendorffii TaxID=88036 RepID=D8TG34_SELML|nr:hypothetical protein SELMODRAFT_432465 [Selaginella moellendorffii]